MTVSKFDLYLKNNYKRYETETVYCKPLFISNSILKYVLAFTSTYARAKGSHDQVMIAYLIDSLTTVEGMYSNCAIVLMGNIKRLIRTPVYPARLS